MSNVVNLTPEEKARIAKSAYQRTYMRKWRAQNKDKIRAEFVRYWSRKFDEIVMKEQQGGV